MQVVLQDALDDGAVGPVGSSRLAAMPRLLAVERDQQVERDDEEVPRADRRIEDLQVAHASPAHASTASSGIGCGT